VSDVRLPTGEEIVETNDLVAFVQEPFAKMRAYEARTPCYQYSVQDIFCIRLRSITQATTITAASDI
jgi:hypothetical protein